MDGTRQAPDFTEQAERFGPGHGYNHNGRPIRPQIPKLAFQCPRCKLEFISAADLATHVDRQCVVPEQEVKESHKRRLYGVAAKALAPLLFGSLLVSLGMSFVPFHSKHHHGSNH